MWDVGAPGVIGGQQWEGPKDWTHIQGLQETVKKEVELPSLSPLFPLFPPPLLSLSPSLPASTPRVGFYAPWPLLII